MERFRPPRDHGNVSVTEHPQVFNPVFNPGVFNPGGSILGLTRRGLELIFSLAALGCVVAASFVSPDAKRSERRPKGPTPAPSSSFANP